jgi:hypothetical protein
MQIAAVPTTNSAHGYQQGVPVATVNGIDRERNETAPMTVFSRANVGRFDGYGSLPSALAAARNLSRGDKRPAVVVQRTDTGSYQVMEAVWRYLWGRQNPPTDRAPYRHFHFEDGSMSAYTAWLSGRKIEVEAQEYYRSYDGETRWLVDGSRVLEVTSQGGSGR